MNRKNTDESVLRRVRKALALAGNNPSEQEAQTAMLMAQRIMAEHGLSIQDVEEPQDQEKKAIHKGATTYSRNPWWKKRLSAIVAGNFRCFSYNNRRSGVSQIRFIGLEQDVALAIEVFNYACDSIKYHSTKYRQELKRRGYYASDVNLMVNDYFSGYLSGLSQKFKEQVDQNNWGLVLVKDALVVKEHEQMNLKPAKASTASFGQDIGSYMRGFEDGKKFDSSRKLIAE